MQHDHREIAKRLLSKAISAGTQLRPKEGLFLGGIAFDANQPTERQSEWLEKLVERYGGSEANG